MPNLQPCAKWTPDCLGKWDYDGRLISISCRYWPRGGGMTIIDSITREFKTNSDLNIKPSAIASIYLNFGIPDEYGFDDYKVLLEQEFEAETEQEVKQLVERWIQTQFDKIVENIGNILNA